MKDVIYVVCCDTAGAHESDDVMSLWTSEDAANTERDRLQALKASGALDLLTTYGGDFAVRPVQLNVSSNAAVNW